jgi:hypothetical protein
MKPTKYCVITLDNPEPKVFNDHPTAFEYCVGLPDKTKGVYKIIRGDSGADLELGSINVWGGHEKLSRMQYNCIKNKTVFKFHII